MKHIYSNITSMWMLKSSCDGLKTMKKRSGTKFLWLTQNQTRMDKEKDREMLKDCSCWLKIRLTELHFEEQKKEAPKKL